MFIREKNYCTKNIQIYKNKIQEKNEALSKEARKGKSNKTREEIYSGETREGTRSYGISGH